MVTSWRDGPGPQASILRLWPYLLAAARSSSLPEVCEAALVAMADVVKALPVVAMKSHNYNEYR